MINALKRENVLHLRPRLKIQKQQVLGMTTAIGFKCEDGIVLGADTEISEGAGKYEESKIQRLNGECFFAYAGRTLVVKDNLEYFQKAAEIADPAELLIQFKAIYLKIWREAHERYLANEPDPFTDFLFVLGENLFVAKGGDFAPVMSDVIGNGKDVARSTIDFFGVPASCRQAKFIIAYALNQAKDFSTGSGKQSEIWEAENGVFKTYPFWVNAAEIEEDFDFVKHWLGRIFLAFPDLKIESEEFSTLSADALRMLKEYRNKKMRKQEKQRKADDALYDKIKRENS